MNRDETRLALAFYFTPGAGPVFFRRCLEEMGSAQALLNASTADLGRVEGMTRPFIERWKNRNDFFARGDRELELAESNGIQVLSYFDKGYPESLKNIPDPPVVLFVRGILAGSPRRVAIVGSRQTSPYGERTALRFASDLAAAGAVVVSGLAHGIDSAAHRGAIDAKGATWAVLGGGILNPGSYRNPKLSEAIYENGGAVLSEYPLHETPRPEYYPRRNRIVSGLSSAVVVIEAGRQSGALITAGLALDQGRDVFAIPGEADSIYSEGSNWLLRQGAKMVRSAADLLEDLGYSSASEEAVLPPLVLTQDEQAMIASILPKTPMHLDDWIERSGKSSQEALSLIGVLVLKGAVSERPGKYFVLEKR